MPNFSHSVEANACVKKLLACFHDEYIWIDTKVPVTIELISQIIGFPMAGVDLLKYFSGKGSDKKLVVKLKRKHVVIKDKHA